MMDSKGMASMYAEIVRGVAKADSLYAGRNEEASAAWDQISIEVAEALRREPRTQFSIPNEWPSW